MPKFAPLTARQVIDALHSRHSHDSGGMGPGRWTCIEEWQNIDMLAFDAWSDGRLVGYEVKVSRGDMRSELLKPSKRSAAVAMTTQFYFAVPAGMLSPEEIAFEEPEWEPGDFARQPCPGIPIAGRTQDREDQRPFLRDRLYGGQCQKVRHAPYTTHNDDGTEIPQGHVVSLPVPRVIKPEPWELDGRYAAEEHLRRYGNRLVKCPNCGGKGYVEKSRVELEAPTLWVPADVGLVVVYESGQTRLIKESPKRTETTSPLLSYTRDADLTKRDRSSIGSLVRWVSQRPDPRH